MPNEFMGSLDVQTLWQNAHSDLDRQLLLAHASDDKEALVSLYTQAANAAERHEDNDAARFYLTHAYIYALDSGHSAHAALERRLNHYQDNTDI